ncbi:MAG: NAD(P)-binding protein [Terriglobia bacterium]
MQTNHRSSARDRELGMDRPITRRDFLNGVALTLGSTLLPVEAPADEGELTMPSTPPEGKGPDVSAQEPLLAKGITPQDSRYYPPALTGMRGNHPGSFEVAHTNRNGDFWKNAGPPANIRETYDLVVVGAGISGLAAAHFYRRQAGHRARILILDNHDDFGGHAKRNEFRAGSRFLLSNGGTQSIESPGLYSKVAKQVLVDLGIYKREFYKDYDRKLYSSMNLGTGVFYNRETFGEDRFVAGMGKLPWPEFMAKAPLSEAARRDIARIYTEKVDYLPGLPREQKHARLGKISYADFLTQIAKLHKDVLPFFQDRTNDLWGVGIDAVSAIDCFYGGDDYGNPLPGFDGMDLVAGGEEEKEEPYIFHFPDGNASIARLLARSLIPGSIPGHTMDDIVTARADYTRLDVASSAVRIRLNSTVVRVRHVGSVESAKEVEVSYTCGGRLQCVQGKLCVLACYNMLIPYICSELPGKQKEALGYGVKVPLVYTHVAIRNWTAFHALGVNQIIAPGSYHTYAALDFPVSIGQYKFPANPEDPMVLFMLRTPCRPGLSERDQHRAGRFELYRTPYAMFEHNIRDQLGRTLSPAGFDPARDIEAITVNRWAHGYAYEYNYLFDPHWPRNERPCVIARQPFGRIAIANSDAGARAYTDCAIDQAYRAVGELSRFA